MSRQGCWRRKRNLSLSRLLEHQPDLEDEVARRVFAEIDRSVAKMQKTVDQAPQFNTGEKANTILTEKAPSPPKDLNYHNKKYLTDTDSVQSIEFSEPNLKWSYRWSMYLFMVIVLTGALYLFWLS